MKKTKASTYFFSLKAADNGIEKLLVSDGIEEISGWIFTSYSKTVGKEIYLSKTLRKIGDGAFQQTQFTKIFIPRSVEEIGSYAFNSNGNNAKIYFEREKNETTGWNNTIWNGNGNNVEVIFGQNDSE